MTNAERQKRLDEEKYYASQKHREDKSGKMPYCSKCEHLSYRNTCYVKQQEREAQCLCAKAYNRLVRYMNERKKRK